jgi:mRNA interferase RelE/StbE
VAAAYRIVFTPAAVRQLAALDAPIRRRVARRIEALETDPWPAGAETLRGGDGETRIRIGDWRVIYLVRRDELVVLVMKIGHRSDIYRAR